MPTSTTVLAIVALLASIVLFMQAKVRLFAIAAIAASGLEVLMAFGVVRFSVARFSLGLVLGAVLAVCGIALYTKVSAKTAVACAAVLTLVGVLQVLAAI